MIARREIFLCDRCVRPQVDPFGDQRTPVGSICGPLAELGRRSCGADVAGWLNATEPLQVPGCAAYHYTLQSVQPFVQPPFEQFTEARNGQGTFTFLTGEGGFLQTFLYGWSGFRWRADRIHVDPALLDQWAANGLTLQHLSYQGRTFTVSIGAKTTVVTLNSGPTVTVESPSKTAQLQPGGRLTMPTRRVTTAGCS
jgi:cellobiose phosphorylase